MIQEDTRKATYYEDPEKIRVIQFHEPNHFKRLFKGKLTYLKV